MIRALWTSASGMEAQQMNLDVIANNLANVNTSGFKKSSIQFQEMMYDTGKTPGASTTDSSTTPTGVQVGYGSKPVATERNFPGQPAANRQHLRRGDSGHRVL